MRTHFNYSVGLAVVCAVALFCTGCSNAKKTNGVCGSSNNEDLTSAPTTNLCSTGTASAVTGTGPWDWSCAGKNGGSAASCSALLESNGACGSSNNADLTSAPTTDLCSAGTASAVTGTGPWDWSCAGSNGGTTASCSALLEVNGACGSSNNSTLASAPTTNLCSAGTASAVTGTGPWDWSCAGSNGGATASCSALAQTAFSNPITLPGCTYPFSAATGSDWGTPLPDASGPFPTGFVNPATIINGNWDGAYASAPTYTSNVVFWQSRETAPGDSVLLAGAFTNTKQTVVVRIATVPPGTVDWQSLVEGSATTVNATNMSSTGLAFKIPATLPSGVFAYRIEDPTAPAIEGRVNLPEVSWAEGVPHSTSQADSLAHHVYACGGEAGTLLRIFGKNFTATTGVFLQDPSGNSHTLTVDTWTPVAIQAEVPAGLSSGNYLLWLGTSSADATSSGAYQIAINSQQQPTVTSGNCPMLVGDGVTDNTANLQSCLAQYAASATDPNHLVNISIPSGTYVISNTITIPPYEYLIGAGSGTGGTAIEGVSTEPPSAWISGTTYFGLANLSVTAPVTENGYVITDAASYNINTSWQATPPLSGHVVLNNVSVLVTADQDSANGAGSQEMVELLGPDIQILNSTLEADTGPNSAPLTFVWGHGGLISGNTIAAKNWAWYQLTDVQNVIFEGNQINASPGGIEEPHSSSFRSQLNQNIFYGNNTVSNVTRTNNQAITTDGGNLAYIGNISSVSGNQITLAYQPDWTQVGNDNMQTLALSIVAGTGTGEYGFVQSVSGQVVTMQQAFSVQPDSTSVLMLTQIDRNVIFANNTFNQVVAESILVYGEGREFTFENNTLTNGGLGIGIAAYGPYGTQWNYQPTFNVDVLNNQISGTSGTYYPTEDSGSAGIYLQQQPGSALSGVLVRGNTIAAPQNIVFTNGCGDETSVLVEDNQATNYPTWMISTCTTQPFPNAILVQGVNY